MFKLDRKLLAVVVVVLILVGVIFASYIFRSDGLPPRPSQGSGDVDAVIKESPVNESSPFVGKPVNELPRYVGRPLGEVRFGAGFSAPQAAIDKNRKDLQALAATLVSDPVGGGVSDWIAVGIIKKFFNDYVGARDAWEYAEVLYPNNGLSFANLGNLYGFYLNDNSKAEFNFKKAIDNDPYQPGYYIGLADFYKAVYVSKKSEAPRVLLEGIGLIRDVNLVLSLAVYYRDVGDKANAVKYYEEVLKMAPDQAGIREEIERLK